MVGMSAAREAVVELSPLLDELAHHLPEPWRCLARFEELDSGADDETSVPWIDRRVHLHAGTQRELLDQFVRKGDGEAVADTHQLAFHTYTVLTIERITKSSRPDFAPWRQQATFHYAQRPCGGSSRPRLPSGG